MEDDEQTVTNKVTSDAKDAARNSIGFPQLKTCGGYEMMRCAPNCRDLSVIVCSWNAKDLHSNLGGGQGKTYLRPIQNSLSTQSLFQSSQSEVKERCQMCNQEILFVSFETIYGLVERDLTQVKRTSRMKFKKPS